MLERIYIEYIQKISIFFSKMGKKQMSPEWHLSFQKTILTQDEILNFVENGDLEVVRKIITLRFNHLIKDDLPKYEEIIKAEMV